MSVFPQAWHPCLFSHKSPALQLDSIRNKIELSGACDHVHFSRAAQSGNRPLKPKKKKKKKLDAFREPPIKGCNRRRRHPPSRQQPLLSWGCSILGNAASGEGDL